MTREFPSHDWDMFWPVTCDKVLQVSSAGKFLAIGSADRKADCEGTIAVCGMLAYSEALVEFDLRFWLAVDV